MERIDKTKAKKKASKKPAQKEGKSRAAHWKEIAGEKCIDFKSLQDLNSLRTVEKNLIEKI